MEASNPFVYGCSGRLNNSATAACSTIFPAYMYRDTLRMLGNHAEVVSDHDDAHAEALLEIGNEREHLGLDGHVERRGRLIRDQEFRFAGQRHGDDRALAHATGQTVRILVDAPARIGNADQVEQLDRP